MKAASGPVYPTRRYLSAACLTRLVLLLGLQLTLSSTLPAADARGNYAIWGEGGRSCYQFRRSADDEASRQTFRHYLMGYLTAYNAVADDTYDALGGVDLKAALTWLDGYCDTHKIDSFDRAITSLVIEHHPTRTRSPGGADSGSWGRAPTPASAPQATP